MEYKVMDYQKVTEYLTDNMIEMGKYDDMNVAVDQCEVIQHDVSIGKSGYPMDSKTEIIQIVAESSHTGGNNLYEDGWLVLLITPKDATELTDGKKSDVDKQAVKRATNHSEHRDDEEETNAEETPTFPTKKGRGQHSNSRKNLVPFKKGQSGNPGGRPTKYANLKSALDKWSADESVPDFLGDPPAHASTMKERVHWRIWYKASQGDTKCIEILAQLGCLDDQLL